MQLCSANSIAPPRAHAPLRVASHRVGASDGEGLVGREIPDNGSTWPGKHLVSGLLPSWLAWSCGVVTFDRSAMLAALYRSPLQKALYHEVAGFFSHGSISPELVVWALQTPCKLRQRSTQLWQGQIHGHEMSPCWGSGA